MKISLSLPTISLVLLKLFQPSIRLLILQGSFFLKISFVTLGFLVVSIMIKVKILSEVIRELCKVANIDKSRTTPYHPQGNGTPERFNQILLNTLAKMKDEQKTKWTAPIPVIVHAYNSFPHSSTGSTPHFLLFRRYPRLVIDAFLGIEPDKSEKECKYYVSGLRHRFKYAYSVARREAKK